MILLYKQRGSETLEIFKRWSLTSVMFVYNFIYLDLGFVRGGGGIYHIIQCLFLKKNKIKHIFEFKCLTTLSSFCYIPNPICILYLYGYDNF